MLNFIIQSVLQPKFVGDAVGLTTTISFLSLIVWAFILGPIGAILAIPASLLVKALLVDMDPDAQWLGLFLGGQAGVQGQAVKGGPAENFGGQGGAAGYADRCRGRSAMSARAGRTWPVFGSLQGYRRVWIRADVVAGLTVWAVLVPEALAYATIAGVPPVVGLYAAIPALVLYAAAGSSRHLVVGPMSATAALSAATVAPFAGGDSALFVALTAALAIVTGIAGLLAGLLRLGFIASFISEPVLKGFIVGLALTIMIGQVPKFFGVPKTEGDFFQQTWGLITHLGDTQTLTLLVGVLSLAVVLACKKWFPLVPGSLLAVLLGTAASVIFGLQDRGVEIVGEIDSGLPDFGLPDAGGLPAYLDLAGPAVGVLIVGFAEGLGRGEDLRGQGGVPDLGQPGAGRPGRSQPRVRAVRRDGGQRKPVQDRGERCRRRPVPGQSGWWWRC